MFWLGSAIFDVVLLADIGKSMNPEKERLLRPDLFLGQGWFWYVVDEVCAVIGEHLLGHSLGVDPIMADQFAQARLTIPLYRSTYYRCRASAPMEYLSHNASYDGNCSRFTPYDCRTK